MQLAPLEELITSIQQIVGMAQLAEPIDGGAIDDTAYYFKGARPTLSEGLLDLSKMCNFIGLEVSSKQARSLSERINETYPRTLLFKDVMGVLTVVHDELESVLLFHIPGLHRKDWGNKTPLGKAIADAFCEGRLDGREAWRCLKLHRPTACVFHLMRLIECGLRALLATFDNQSLSVKKASWGTLIQEIRKEAKKPDGQISARWTGKQDVLIGLATRLETIKDSVRNDTIHVWSDYDVDGAQDVFDATRIFMNALAEAIGGSATP